MIGVALRTLVFFAILTGVVYPLAITGLAQVAFPKQANGSLLVKEGKTLGSRLIAQKFTSPGHFWSRPSAIDFNPMPSGGSNLGPTSADLRAKVEERRKAGMTEDLQFASASGLDPHISVAGARSQSGRVAGARNLSTRQVDALIDLHTEPRQFGFLGEPRVMVLELNLALDDLGRSTNQ